MVSTARERARAALTEEILASARTQLATVGAAALSLRAVARDLGMASSALYRYFPSRDDLLTRLIQEGYDALGAAAEEADDPAQQPRARWHAVCAAIRAWARANPHEWALLYGSPVPGYAAPADTVPAAARVGVVLGGILGDAARAGLLPPPEGRRTHLVLPAATAVLGGDHPALDDATRARALMTWSAVHGMVSFELFGHFVGSVADGDAFFTEQVGELADLLGL
ncbi:TetR/AcrR family transcriptional regulator [Klenkia sp. LSe6-5]|uniref:TetR/AcrR family transcriptional regulator n=1 Tax=Klenkia sesuvii TaxID=3103137 RepID=A0ABU8DQ71_9ACTN